MNQSSNTRGLHDAAESTEHPFVSDLLSQLSHRILDTALHAPLPSTTTNLIQETTDHLISVLRMAHFRMELNGIYLPIRVAHGSHRSRRGPAIHLEALWRKGYNVRMTHPDGFGFALPLEQRGIRNDLHVRLPVFPLLCAVHFCAEMGTNQLHAVADPQNRNSQFKDRRIAGRRSFGEDAGRSAGKDDPLRRHLLNFLRTGLIWHHLTKNTFIPDPTRDQLIVLSPEIQDHH